MLGRLSSPEQPQKIENVNIHNSILHHRYGESLSIPGLQFMRETYSRQNIDTSVIQKALLLKLKLNKEIATGPDWRTGTDISVFGIEFSDDGKLLASSHSDGSVRVFDNRNHRMIWLNENAHIEPVNGCTFIDSNSFASYSDDGLIKVWDIRNPTSSLKVLTGHTDWVKNVNIMETANGKVLLSSGLDETIRMFDLTMPEDCIKAPPVFYFPFLYRVKLSTTGNFLIFSTTRTSVFKIANLNLDTLWADYSTFMLDDARTDIFTKKRNTLEMVHYIPGFHPYSNGYSVSIHPDNECCVVRHARSCSNADDVVPEHELPTSEWIAAYNLRDTTDEVPSPYQPYSLDSIIPDVESVSGVQILWDHACMNDRVKENLLQNASTPRKRLSMVFRGWLETTNSCKPQDLNDATFFKEFQDKSYGIIKETDIDSSGRLVVTPCDGGFQILAYNEELNSFKTALTKLKKDNPMMEAKQLTLVKECRLAVDAPCYCIRFSPVGNSVVAGDSKGKVMWFDPLDSQCDGF